MPKIYKNKTHRKKTYIKKTKTQAGKNAEAESRELLASIQAYPLQLEQLTQMLATMRPVLQAKSMQYTLISNSMLTSYEYDHRNIPSVLLTMLHSILPVIEKINHLLRCLNEPAFLASELARHGYNNFMSFIELTLNNMEELDEKLVDYRSSVLADYRGAQLGIETQPTMRNRTTRRTDAIVRPGRTTRAQALTRRIRSF
jgi:hypothetical protein